MKSIGRCFECKRLMSIKILEQVRFYEFHKIENQYHHKLICKSCLKMIGELKWKKSTKKLTQ